jgi:hypothetical protein
MPGFRVTGRTLGSGAQHAVLMRIMATHAREGAFTLQEAQTPAKIHWLVPYIPRILEVGGDALRGRHPVALPAAFVHF